MPIMMERLYDALRAANVPDDQARAAAVEAAEHGNEITGVRIELAGVKARITAVEARLDALEGRVTILTWMVGINIALTAAVIGKLLTLH